MTYGIDWTLLAAIGIRESGFQNVNQVGGGAGVGVFQIDLSQNPSVSRETAESLELSANWVGAALADMMGGLTRDFNLAGPNLEAFAVSAHNTGRGRAMSALHRLQGQGIAPQDLDPFSLDRYTAHGNYTAHVANLRSCFK